MMENFFDTAVLAVTISAVAASLVLLGALLSGKLYTVDIRPFDKSKLTYTDGDNT